MTSDAAMMPPGAAKVTAEPAAILEKTATPRATATPAPASTPDATATPGATAVGGTRDEVAWRTRRGRWATTALAGAAVLLLAPGAATAQESRYTAEAAQIVKADADFARSVAEKSRDRFLSFIADVTTFNGGSTSELRGRDAVMKDWNDFFEADGPTLTWTPTKGEVFGAGDLGYTTGRSVFRAKGPNGAITERHGEYLTVWRRQRDGTWKVIFDTGSTLPASAR